MTAMNWRDRIIEQNWLQPFLPNYMRPLNEPAMMNEDTKEFVFEAEEFISDLAALVELPRMNKTFKRSIQGFTYKIKIKPKKIQVEMIDNQKSSASLKKRVFITIYRHHVKESNGQGKVMDATIYYQKEGRTHVRSIRRHPVFQPLFYHIHRLDMSISGQQLPGKVQSASSPEQTPEIPSDQEAEALLDALKDVKKRFSEVQEASDLLQQMIPPMEKTAEEYALLDIEEKHDLKRMILHDIPNLLQTYVSLSADQKKDSRDRMLYSLDNMYSIIKKQAEDLQATRMERMNHLLQLNELRYSPEYQNNQMKTSTMMKKHQKQIDEQ
ncbi:MAG: hypothetical protein EA344_04295 [Alkalicoccus sp.]|nr:MAG: hypothetical protein EA344_04295 [Alkalicoccus sp.]